MVSIVLMNGFDMVVVLIVLVLSSTGFGFDLGFDMVPKNNYFQTMKL